MASEDRTGAERQKGERYQRDRDRLNRELTERVNGQKREQRDSKQRTNTETKERWKREETIGKQRAKRQHI